MHNYFKSGGFCKTMTEVGVAFENEDLRLKLWSKRVRKCSKQMFTSLFSVVVWIGENDKKMRALGIKIFCFIFAEKKIAENFENALISMDGPLISSTADLLC